LRGDFAMWPFKGKRKPELPLLPFKSGQGFFEYHCKFMDTRIEPGKALAAIVLDAKEEFGTETAVKLDERGIQTATIRVASDAGGFITFAQTASERGEPLAPGDVVAWIPGIHRADIAKAMGSEEGGWIGMIVAKIAPEIDMNSGQMTVICSY
jgi:hypothetical protein